MLVKDPVAVPEAVKLTVPDGITDVPRFVLLSVTVAVQVVGWFTTTGLAHEMDVAVTRRATLTFAVEVAALVACAWSVGV